MCRVKVLPRGGLNGLRGHLGQALASGADACRAFLVSLRQGQALSYSGSVSKSTTQPTRGLCSLYGWQCPPDTTEKLRLLIVVTAWGIVPLC